MLNDPPPPNEIEVSIFGPGKGESVLIHLGYGVWMIVDSCIDQIDDTVPALAYLERIGVDAATAVRAVVATHAHDDHIAGVSRIFDACESAQFVCSSALTMEEFIALVEIDEMQSSPRARIRQEYKRVFEIVERRGRARAGFKPMRYALEGRPLLQVDNGDGQPYTKVVCLSPSDEAVSRSLKLLAAAFPKDGERRRSPTGDPNELAVGIWIESSDGAVLLGADLTNGPAGCGWNAVLATFNSNNRASLFKIPHHGSANAHHPQVWTKMVDEPVALLAPYRPGPRRHPAPDDIRRLRALSRSVHITASPSVPTQSSRIKREAAALKPLARNVVEPWGRSGHVRARSSSGSNGWKIEHVPPARQL